MCGATPRAKLRGIIVAFLLHPPDVGWLSFFMEVQSQMRLRLFSLAMTVALLAVFIVPFGSALAAPPATSNPLTGKPITQTYTDAAGNPATFTGTLNITQFAVQNGQLVALGTVTG